MNKLIFESLNSFIRNQDPVKSLGLGYEAKIRDFFRQYDVPNDYYEINENGKIIFKRSLKLKGALNITELPDNLTIIGSLDLDYSSIIKLPENLSIFESTIAYGHLLLRDTLIKTIPDSLKITDDIFVYRGQEELINFIEHSKFKDKLRIL
jgi:hypothetical protein